MTTAYYMLRVMRKLYHNWFCPFSRAVRILLAEKGLEFNLVHEKVWERRPEFLALNPAATTPVLVEPDGQILAGIYAVSEYLEEAFPDSDMLGNTAKSRGETRRLVSWFHDKFHSEVTHHLITEKVMKRFLAMGEPDSHALRCAANNIRHHLDYICYLNDRREWLSGDNFTLADIAAAAHLSCADYFDSISWDRHEDAKNWYMRVKSRPSMRAILKDRIAGLAPPKHYSLLDF